MVLNGESVQLSDNGLFAFGFGREAELTHTVSWQVAGSEDKHNKYGMILGRDLLSEN